MAERQWIDIMKYVNIDDCHNRTGKEGEPNHHASSLFFNIHSLSVMRITVVGCH
jgi:hypothetical protein